MEQGKIMEARGTDSPDEHHPNRTNGAPTPTTPARFFTGRMPFLPPNQQHQSTEGIIQTTENAAKINKSDEME